MSDELIIKTETLDSSTNELAQKIIDEQDIKAVKDLTHLFNLNQAKKNVLRVMKLNNLLDTVSDKIIDRFDRYPDNFSNDDLIKFMQVTENAIEKANKNLNLVDSTPAIQVNHNNQLNVNIIDSYDRDSRERVLEYINQVLNSESQDSLQDITDIKEEDDTDE